MLLKSESGDWKVGCLILMKDKDDRMDTLEFGLDGLFDLG